MYLCVCVCVCVCTRICNVSHASRACSDAPACRFYFHGHALASLHSCIPLIVSEAEVELGVSQVSSKQPLVVI